MNRFEEEARERQSHADRMRREYLDAAIPDEVADLLFGYAWQAGHSAGWSEVEFHYGDLAELVEKAYRAGVTA